MTKKVKYMLPALAVPVALFGLGLCAPRTFGANKDGLLNIIFNGRSIGSGLEIHGAAYIPAREVAEALNAAVTYNRPAHTVKIEGGTYQKGRAVGFALGQFATYNKENPAPRSLDNDSMYGIKSLTVEIEKLDPEGNRTPGLTLTEEQLKEDVELKLLQNDIKIAEVGKSDGLFDIAVTIVPVRVDQSKPGDPGFAYSVELLLSQSVKLNRDKSILTSADTWSSASTNVTGKEGASEAMRKKVSEQVNAFIAEYQKENVKQSN